MKQKHVLCIGLALVLATSDLLVRAQSSSVRPLHGPGYNLLVNPGHEHPGVYFAGRGEINVSWSWVPFWEEPPANADPRDPNYRTPEFRPVLAQEYPYRVRSGDGSDRWFNFFALNRAAGIMQYVADVPVGAPIRFTTHVQLWSSQDEHYNPDSAKRNDGGLKVRACIDQDGGPRNMSDPELICSDWFEEADVWKQLVVDGVAKNGVVNVLIWSSAALPVQHNDVYVDESCFEVLPSQNAPGVCKGAGLVPTGDKVLPLPPDYVNLRVTAEQQKTLPRHNAPVTEQLAPVRRPAGSKPALAVRARSVLNVRELPSTTSKVVARAKRGDVLPVIGRTADRRWFQVEVGRVRGWVSATLTLPNTAALRAPIVKP
ncbi:MAG: SH3 domain-containing protein [Thermoflexales bacterium]